MSKSPQFKSYKEGNLIFKNIKAEKAKKGNPPLFNYNGKDRISSEEVGKEYYKSEGYSAVFSENEIWNSFFNQLIYRNLKKLYALGDITTKNHQLFDDEFYRENETAINKLFNANFPLYSYTNWAFLQDMKEIRDRCVMMMNVNEEELAEFSQQHTTEHINPERKAQEQKMQEEMIEAMMLINEAQEKLKY